MSYLLDTTNLARLVLPADPHHLVADSAAATLISQDEDLYVTPQVLIELRSVATRPARPPSNGLGISSGAADAEIERILALFGFRPDTAAIFTRWKQLVSTHGVLGRNVHDARIAAVMLVYGISHFLTLNGSHFKRFPGLTVVSPADISPNP